MRTVRIKQLLPAFRLFAASIAVVCLMAGSVVAGETSMWLTGDGLDYITQGLTYSYNDGDGTTFTATSLDTGVSVNISVIGPSFSYHWYLDFEAPNGQQLAPGFYPFATRYPFNDPDVPGLSVFGQFRGCNILGGEFTVNEASFGPNGEVLALDVSFIQHCEGQPPAAWGYIKINATAATPIEEVTWGAIKAVFKTEN